MKTMHLKVMGGSGRKILALAILYCPFCRLWTDDATFAEHLEQEHGHKVLITPDIPPTEH